MGSQGSLELEGLLEGRPGVSMDQVWKDVHNSNNGNSNDQNMVGQEITLEDFLLKAGAVRGRRQQRERGEAEEEEEEEEEEDGGVTNNDSVTAAFGYGDATVAAHSALSLQEHQQREAEWLLQLQMKAACHQQQQQHPHFGGVADRSHRVGIGEPSSSSSSAWHRQEGKKRAMERTVERRQKRMIKNRESAARSRARKQAYTNELENEVTQLLEENAKLKMQQVSENLIPALQSQQSRKVLQRTLTAPF